MATNTAASFSTPIADGTAGPFNIGFTYLAQSEIDVTVDGQPKTLGTHYTFHSTTQISFTDGNFPTSGQTIRFQRNTDISAKKVDFVNGSVLTETDLDNNSDQVLFGLQEFVDELNTNVVKKDGGLAQITDAANLAALTDNERLILDGATVSTTELNTLDGVNSTLTASELNVLDGITASTANLNQLTNKEVETSLTANSDAKIPTSKAVNDRILTVTNALGGFVAIANETSFPSTHPDPSSNAGTVVSISDAGGVVVNSSGVATITNGAGTGNTVTINSFPSDLHSKTLGSGVGLQVQTTTTLHTYTYHKVLLKESDLINLSNDIDDFGNRYRVVDTTPTSNNDEGDLIFRKSDNKLLVFNGTAYQEASSVGNFHTNTLSSFNGTGGGSATFNGSAYRFNIDHPPELAEQLLVSINGVIQKPNSGTSQPSEGFALSGSSVIFSAAPASGSDFFIITIGKSVDIGHINDGVVTNVKVASDASIEGTKINPNFGSQNVSTTGNLTISGNSILGDSTSDTVSINGLINSHLFPALGANRFIGADTARWSALYVDSVNTDAIRLDSGTGKLQIGHTPELEIYHNNTNGFIDNNKGNLYIRNNVNDDDNGDIIIEGKSGETSIKCVNDGVTQLYYDGNLKLTTTLFGVEITGDITVSGNFTVNGTTTTIDTTTLTVEDKNIELGKVSTPTDTTADGGGITLKGATDKTFQWLDATDSWTSSEHIALPDSKKLQLGDSQDLQIFHTGSGSVIDDVGTGFLHLRRNGSNRINITDNAVQLAFDGTSKLETTSTGITASGTQHLFTSSTSGDCTVIIEADTDNNDESDNPKIIFRQDGGLDLGSIGMNLTDVTDVSPSNELYIATSSAAAAIVFATGTTNGYTNATEKLRITHEGNIQIPNDSGKLQLGASQDLELYHDGSNSFIKDSGTGRLNVLANAFAVQNDAGTENIIRCFENGAVELYYDHSKKLETTSTGVTVTGVGSINNSSSTTGIGLEIKNSSTSAFSTSENLEGTTNAKLTPLVLRNLGNAANAETYLGFDAGASSKAQWNIGIRKTSALSGDFIFNTRTGSSTSAERLRITSDGNVGIGTTSPSAKLDVNGDATINSITVGKGANSVTGNTVLGENALDAAVTGGNNTAIGDSALTSLTSATSNVAVGHDALRTNTTGNTQVAIGDSALYSNSTGLDNVAIGAFCLYSNSTASNNVGVGRRVLFANTTGTNNVAMGYGALDANTTADNSVAVGYNALTANTTGNKNTALGGSTLDANTTGIENTAVGHNALGANTTANQNTAVGRNALAANTTGNKNVAVGLGALINTTTSNGNTAIGWQALTGTSGNNNTAVGRQALENNTASDNAAFGHTALRDNTSGSNNAAFGDRSLQKNTTGGNNTAAGRSALQQNTTGSNNVAVGSGCLDVNTTGNSNVAVGTSALDANTTASHNTAIGVSALSENTTGTQNTACGGNSLDANTTGSYNTAVGRASLGANTTGTHNTAIGGDSLDSNTTGDSNTGVGYQALQANTTGENNVAVGRGTLYLNSTAVDNIAMGRDALFLNTTGSSNSALGKDALKNNSTGSANTAVGKEALTANTTGTSNVALGRNALKGNTTGISNVAVGRDAGDSITTGDNNTVIGNNADASSATVNNEITLGNSNSATLRCNVQTISSLSDARDKTNVIDLPEGLDFVTKLRPVKFEWATRDGNGKDGSFEHGFIAQDLQAAQKENDADYLNMVMDENPDRLEASYGKLVPILVKAIQELTMEVNKLKSNG